MLSCSYFHRVAATLLLQGQLLLRISFSTLARFLAAIQRVRHDGDVSRGINFLR